ncbi:MAG: hypothetical protein FWH20_09525 [Oscillospiraceae bacterium]|nr:hypothetical protein [Oscillospiraceae bacterium]
MSENPAIRGKRPAIRGKRPAIRGTPPRLSAGQPPLFAGNAPPFGGGLPRNCVSAAGYPETASRRRAIPQPPCASRATQDRSFELNSHESGLRPLLRLTEFP